MMIGNHRISWASTTEKNFASGFMHTPDHIATFMTTTLLLLVGNVLCGFSF